MQLVQVFVGMLFSKHHLSVIILSFCLSVLVYLISSSFIGWMGWVVIIGHRSSKSTFGANNKYLMANKTSTQERKQITICFSTYRVSQKIVAYRMLLKPENPNQD